MGNHDKIIITEYCITNINENIHKHVFLPTTIEHIFRKFALTVNAVCSASVYTSYDIFISMK